MRDQPQDLGTDYRLYQFTRRRPHTALISVNMYTLGTAQNMACLHQREPIAE